MTGGIQRSTAKSYSSMQQSYLAFCELLKLLPVPATERVLLTYIAWLHKKGRSHSTISSHLSAVRHLHIMNGYKAEHIRTDKVKLALRCIFIHSPPPCQKKPIDFSLLVEVWRSIEISVDTYLWQAIICLGFFGGLRGSEYTANVKLSSGPRIHNISFNKDLKAMRYQISSCKTNPHGFTSLLGCSGSHICPVCTMKKYLKWRASFQKVDSDSWLFVDSTLKPVSKASLDMFIHKIITSSGRDGASYSTHSLRAGAATSAAQAGCPDYEVMAIGNWKSQVFTRYIRNKDYITRNWPQKVARGSKV